MRDKERRHGPGRLVDRLAQWCRATFAALGRRADSRRAKAALAALALVLSNLLGALTPVVAYAALNFEPIALETVSESEMEDGAYSWSINFTGWDESSAVGFRRVEHPEGFITPTNGMRDYARTAAGWAAEIGPNTPKGSFSVRATGGQYGSTPIDAIITLSDWTYEEPRGGWGTMVDRGSWPEFTTGVFMFDGLSQTYLPDKPESVTGVESLNFYTIGLTDLVVNVEFVRAGTNTPVGVRGHLTTTDLDMWQSFSFGGAVSRGRIAQGNPVLKLSSDGKMVVSNNSNLSVADPIDYKNGLVEAYFDTSGGEPLKFYFGTSWSVPEGTDGRTFESVFWLTPEYLTVPPADVEGSTTVTKSADKTGENSITVGDEVEYVVDYQAHEQGENCRWGYRYTALQIVDELPAEMRYVEGSARLLDGSGADVTAQAGAVVTDADDNTVSFEFSEDYLKQMPMEGEHYRLTFKAALAEYPANGDLFVINRSYALVNDADENRSNEVRTELAPVDLVVDKTADAYEYQVGDVVSFRVACRLDAEQGSARDVVISDALPEQLELLPETLAASGSEGLPAPVATENGWELSLDALACDEEVVVTYRARVLEAGNGQELVNLATARAAGASEVSDPEEVWPNTAQLEVEKDVDRFEGYVGASDADPGYFEYAVRVRNAQPGTVANDVVVSDVSLPEGLALGRNEDGTPMIAAVREDGSDLPLSWTDGVASGTLSEIAYRVGGDDHVPGETEAVTPAWSIAPSGTGWQMTIDHLAPEREIEIVYHAVPTDEVAGWEVENRAEATATNSAPADDAERVWVNQPKLEVAKTASAEEFAVGDEITYQIRVTNATPGTLGRNVVVSDLASTEGVELLRDSMCVLDSTGQDITESCEIVFEDAAQETDSEQGEKDDAPEQDVTDIEAGTDDGGEQVVPDAEAQTDADGEAQAAPDADAEPTARSFVLRTNRDLVSGSGERPTWSAGALSSATGENPIDASPESPREGSLSCETALTVEYRVKVTDAELAGRTVENTAHAETDEPGTETTDQEVVDVKGPRLRVQKTSDKTAYQAGETARYDLSVSRVREEPAVGIVVTDHMDEPGAASIVDGSVVVTDQDGNALEVEVEYERSEDGSIVGFRAPTGLTLDDERPIGVSYDVVMTRAGATVRNVAQATTEDGLSGTAENTVTIEASGEGIQLDKSVDRDVVPVGEWAAYVVTVAAADSPATGVVVRDAGLPEEMPIDLESVTLQLNGENVDAQAVTADNNSLVVEVGELRPGDVARLSYRAQARDEALMGTSVVNTATLTADGLDEPLSDDARVSVPAPEPLETDETTLEKTADADEVAVGETVSYVVRAVAGTDLTDATLSDSGLPEGAGVDESSVRMSVNDEERDDLVPVMDGTGFSIELGDLSAGDVIEVAYQATVEDEALAGETLVNMALLESPDLPEPIDASQAVDVTAPDDPEPKPTTSEPEEPAVTTGPFPNTGQSAAAALLIVFGLGVALVATVIRVREARRVRSRR